ncbi:uncharacterized protein LOC110226212 [Arabidopsis lyrata subsp. lyrata]|uniref:uncharacterized protein LOC110226212 n=1 Tax=Arabidopsis lyrata subsp. lyrata TaxID=81972 RepID=UPI000A29B3D9|nr:uncharacterized protein LOC110226212 [Arabidopsis lyrata subsp. lyrata]|eukprot:XP_020872642.1 uncharacterized protein LOC110226212 [Arabidopsis lyrata subsp. lyrata]
MIPKSICSVIEFQCLIAFLSFHESFFPTTIRQWSRNSGGDFPLEFCLGGLRCLNIEHIPLQHRQAHDLDVNFFKLRKGFQTQIWDPGVPICRFANGGIRLLIDHISGSRFMFVLAMETSILYFTKMSIIFPIGGHFFSPFVSFGLRETLLGFEIRISLGLDDEPVALPQSLEEEMNSVIQRGLWFLAYWMITIHRWPPNFQDEASKSIPLRIQEWRIPAEYLSNHIILLIEKANQVRGDYILVSDFDQHVDVVAEKLRYIKATFAKGQFIKSDIVFVPWYRGSLDVRDLCPIWDKPANIDWLHLKQSLWQEAWERKQRIYHDEHKESLRELSSTLITMRRQVPEIFPTTLIFISLDDVMPRTFWSFNYMLIANKKCVKGGHNRLYLLAYKSKDSMVTLHSFIEIVIISCICVIGRFEILMYLVNTF